MTTKRKKAVYKYNYYDADGKRRCKSFSATTKAAARALALEWESNNIDDGRPILTVSEALQHYLDAKRGVLSPSTLRSYEGMQKNHFADIGKISIRRLTNVDVQQWVSRLSLSGLSAKTVKNCFGLLTAAVAMQDDNIRIRVQLPQQKVYDNYCPTDADISALISQIQRDGDGELLRAVLLSAFGPLRRSEACALEASDVKGNTVYINKAIVKDSTGAWIVKLPKTKGSTRKIVYPDFVIRECAGIEGRIIPHTPDYIGDKFRKTLKKINVPHFRFHDLRHYGASIMMYMDGKVSQRTIENRGGWAPGSPVLRRIYQNTLEDKEKKETEAINNYFKKFEANFEA